MKRILNFLLSLILSLFIITSVIKFTVNFKQLYYFDMSYLNIPILSDMNEEDIKLNYDYLIEYNISPEKMNFKLPTLESSVKGKIHFEEVRDIFQNIDSINKITLILVIVGSYICIKYKNVYVLKYSAWTLITLPILISIPIIINFEKSFELFHKLFFNNNYWIFNPAIDPVINMLPEEFFLHAGMMILLLIFITSALMLFSYKKLIKKEW